jgi:hypothetical protein
LNGQIGKVGYDYFLTLDSLEIKDNKRGGIEEEFLSVSREDLIAGHILAETPEHCCPFKTMYAS